MNAGERPRTHPVPPPPQLESVLEAPKLRQASGRGMSGLGWGLPNAGACHQSVAVLVEEQHEDPRSVSSPDLAQSNRSAVSIEAVHGLLQAGRLDALPEGVPEAASVDSGE